MSAETGVGPAMASGSQTNNGIWALLPVAPMKSSRMAQFRLVCDMAAVGSARSVQKSSPPSSRNSRNIDTRKAASPMRLTKNDLLAGMLFQMSSYQNPISRYEQR